MEYPWIHMFGQSNHIIDIKTYFHQHLWFLIDCWFNDRCFIHLTKLGLYASKYAKSPTTIHKLVNPDFEWYMS